MSCATDQVQRSARSGRRPTPTDEVFDYPFQLLPGISITCARMASVKLLYGMNSLSTKIDLITERLRQPACSYNQALQGGIYCSKAADVLMQLELQYCTISRRTGRYGIGETTRRGVRYSPSFERAIVLGDILNYGIVILSWIMTLNILRLTNESDGAMPALLFHILHMIDRSLLSEIQQECLLDQVPDNPMHGVAIKLHRPSANGEQGDDCPICRIEDIGEAEFVYRLACGHQFHRFCLIEWVKNSNTCPLCRFEVLTKDNPSETY